MADTGDTSFLARFGGKLIDRGYRILPIPRGDKTPPTDKEFGNWRKVASTPALLRTWIADKYQRSGVGIDTRDAPGVDLDIFDPAAVEHMKNFVIDRLGIAPIRVGQAPKMLLAFRCETRFPKISSKYWVDEFCPVLGKDGLTKPHRVEILADGQQYVAYHVHPDTGQPYKWIANGSPLKIAREDLPLITQDDAQAIADEFDRYAAEVMGWTEKHNTHQIGRLKALPGRRFDLDDPFANDKQRTDISDDDLSRKLMLVPGAENYETWVQIGMALWHQYAGEPQGLDMWHEWSATASNYDSAELDAKWETFDAEGKSQTPMTARIIIKLADEHEKVIRVETFREVVQKLAETDSTDTLKTACDEIKQIEFGVMQRMQLADKVQAAYKRITQGTMTIGVARGLIKYEQPPTKERPKWLDGWVYIQMDNSFFDKAKGFTLSQEAFNATFNRKMLTKVERAEGKSVPETQAAPFALNNTEIDTYYNRMYFPGEDDVFVYNSLPYVNSYSAKNIPDVPEKLNRHERRAIKRVADHLELLFPGDHVLLDAMAWIVQNPGKRLNWAPLMQGQEADGKSFFSGVLAAALGKQNVKILTADALEEKYTSWAEGAQVCFFEEVKLHGHRRYDILNKVKPLITNVTVSVRRMNTDIYEALNMSTYIFTTNHKDALPLNDNDTRYYILFSTFQLKEHLEDFKAANPSYYDDLYATLEHAGALRKWLLSHPVPNTFKPYGRAPFSKDKAEMVSYVEKEEAAGLKELLNGKSGVDGTLVDVAMLAEKMGEIGVDVPYGKAMAHLLMDNGFSKIGKVRLGKETHVFWSQKPQLFRSKDGSPDVLAVKRYLADGGL